MTSPSDADPFDFDPNAFSLDGLSVEGFDQEAEGEGGGDPLSEIVATGDQEKDARAELSGLLQAFKRRSADEEKRRELATDTEYWIAVCFETREQKEAFLAAVDLLRHGDKYLDGYAVAARFGVVLPLAHVPYNAGKRPDRKLAELVIGAGEQHPPRER